MISYTRSFLQGELKKAIQFLKEDSNLQFEQSRFLYSTEKGRQGREMGDISDWSWK